MTKLDYYNNCIAILNSCWKGMQQNMDDWKKALDAFGEVCNRASDQAVTDFAVKCVELLEYKFYKGDSNDRN